MPWWKRSVATLDDAVFGRLVRDQFGWKVEAKNESEHLPLISLVAGDAGPTDAQRSAYGELEGQLRALAGDLTSTLYEMYSPYLELPNWEGPRPRSAADLREMLYLSGVRYLEDGTPELWFAFKGDVWRDAMFTVEIRNGRVQGVSLDD